jgi:hypothetical protein
MPDAVQQFATVRRPRAFAAAAATLAAYVYVQTDLLLKGDEGLVDPPLLFASPNVRIGQSVAASLVVVGGGSNDDGGSSKIVPTLIRSMPLLDFAAPAVATKVESKARMTGAILATLHPLLFPPSLPISPIFPIFPFFLSPPLLQRLAESMI